LLIFAAHNIDASGRFDSFNSIVTLGEPSAIDSIFATMNSKSMDASGAGSRFAILYYSTIYYYSSINKVYNVRQVGIIG